MDDNLQRTAARFMPGAALGIAHFPENLRPIIDRGAGSRIWDTGGKEYIDYVLGSGPMLVGHAHPEIVEAVREQAGKSSTFYVLNGPAIRLAERVVQAAPCGETLKFQLGGTDATFNALRIARAYTGREIVVKFEGGFHGWHDVAQHSLAIRSGARPNAIPESAGISASIRDDIKVARFNDLGSVEELLAEYGEQVAAIIVEPMQRALAPKPGFLAGLRELATQNGAVLIFDEIVTGFRLAWGGAQGRYGVVPDIACYGKALGGGYPVSAIVGKAELIALADPARKGGNGTYCYVGGTFTGNPVSSAAALATLDVLDRPGVYEALQERGETFRREMTRLGNEAGIPLKVIGDGPVAQIVFTSADTIETPDDLRSADATKHKKFAYEMIARGIFMLPGGKVYISTAHSDEDIAKALDCARDALRTF